MSWESPRTRRTTPAARSPPAAPTPTPAIPPSARSPASPRAATTSVAGETGASVVDLETPSRPAPSPSEPDPRRARALPRTTTILPSWITCLEMQGLMTTISNYCDLCSDNKILFKVAFEVSIQFHANVHFTNWNLASVVINCHLSMYKICHWSNTLTYYVCSLKFYKILSYFILSRV